MMPRRTRDKANQANIVHEMKKKKKQRKYEIAFGLKAKLIWQRAPRVPIKKVIADAITTHIIY